MMVKFIQCRKSRGYNFRLNLLIIMDKHCLERVGTYMDIKERNSKFMEAVSCFLKGQKVQWKEAISEEEWEQLFELSIQHQILPFLFETVYACPAFASLPREKVQWLKRQMLSQIVVQSRKTEEFLGLYKRLLEAGLTPIVVKGIICRNLYREPDYRASGDEDLLIPSEEFKLYSEIFLENGMKYVEPSADAEKEGEVPFYKEGGTLRIELHKELFPSESQAYGYFNKVFENVFKNKIIFNVQGVPVYTLTYTDHLLYLLMHAFKHFLHSGFGVRQVCDIILYANTYGQKIDWTYVYNTMAGIHGELFSASIFDIGSRYLNFDMEKACYPKIWRKAKANGEELLEDLIAGGIFGDSSISRKHSSNITLQAVTERKEQGKLKKPLIWQCVFPDMKYMERTYTYLKTYPFLLPVAWISRLKRYQREMKQKQNNDARKSIEIGNRRVNLMKKYKII